MRAFLWQFCLDEHGYVVAMEWVFVASILTLGSAIGLLAMRQVEEKPVDCPPSLVR